MIQLFFAYADYGLLVLRIALGALLIVHGFPKLKDIRGTGAWMASVGFRPGVLFAVAAGGIEFFGGFAVLFGFLIQPVALLVALQFLIIACTVKRKAGFVGGLELDLLIFGAAITLATVGGGAFGLDERFGFVVY